MRTGPGVYMAAEADFPAHQNLAQAGKLVPHGIICLLSALRFHDISIQNLFDDHPFLFSVSPPNIFTPPRSINRMVQEILAA